MLSGKISKDSLLEMIYNDVDLEMAIRIKVEDILKEVMENYQPIEKSVVRPAPVTTNDTNVYAKIIEYKKRMEEQYENEEKEYYYLKGKGISTEMNDINFAAMKEDLSKKEELVELLLEILV